MRKGHINRISRSVRRPRQAIWLTLVVALCAAMALAVLGPGATTNAQTDGSDFAAASPVPGGVTPGADQSPPPATQPDQQDTDAPTQDPGSESTDQSQTQSQSQQGGTTPPATQSDGSTPSDATSDGGDAESTNSDANETSSGAGESAPASTLTYTPAEQPRCKPSGDAPEVVAQGDHLDYTCSYRVGLTAAQVAPAAIRLDWTVDAAVGGGWQVQLRPPVVDSDNPPPWTDDPHPTATLHQQGPIAPVASAEVAATLDTTAKLTFRLRVYRVACGTDAQPVTLKLAVAASLPRIDGATVEPAGPIPDPIELHPALVPIPEPSVAFRGSLDFGDIAVDAMGVKRPPKPQSITVTVDGLDQACGEYQLTIISEPFSEHDQSTPSDVKLKLVSINGDALPDEGCVFDTGCSIAVIHAGPEARATSAFSLGVALVLPDQPQPATFASTITASLDQTSSTPAQDVGTPATE